MPRRTGSSQRWRQRQERDIYVEQANRAGWRSRAVFKLEQIQAKERLLRARHASASISAPRPGSWSQLAARLVGPSGRVVAVDLLPMDADPGRRVPRGRFHARRDAARRCASSSAPKPVDLVMSDMAPNISGNRAMDQPRSMALLDEALLFAEEVLKPGGDFLVKAFQGEGIDAFTRELTAALRDRENDQTEGVAGREPRDLFAG